VQVLDVEFFVAFDVPVDLLILGRSVEEAQSRLRGGRGQRSFTY
jgi:hypothetical protein